MTITSELKKTEMETLRGRIYILENVKDEEGNEDGKNEDGGKSEEGWKCEEGMKRVNVCILRKLG